MANERSNNHQIFQCLESALEAEKVYLRTYERASESITYETARSFDDLFCRELMQPHEEVSPQSRMCQRISTWGVNHALRRILPEKSTASQFRDFPSNQLFRQKADDFVYHSGALAIAERLKGWLEDDLLVGEIRPYPNSQLDNILVLRDSAESCYNEEIGMSGLNWASDRVWQEGLTNESTLEDRYLEIYSSLEQHVKLLDGWRISYTCTPEIDEHFFEWGQHYLRRIFSQDMIGLDDEIGGRPFSQYIDVLTALSARSQKHIAFAAILRARHPEVHLRNLLTTYCPRQFFVESLADYMEAEISEIESILSSFTLASDNIIPHTRSNETAWAPIIQTSSETLILPTYGIDINPFLFLLNDLRFRYESDWFRVANNREGRWISELQEQFSLPCWQTNDRNLRMRHEGKVVTDIDFAVFNPESNELGLFQLKWQQPIGLDNRTRRSAGKNLINECNRWIAAVSDWLDLYGVEELMKRLGFNCSRKPVVHCFILGRYHVHLSGYDQYDERAVWSDWANFRRVWVNEKVSTLHKISTKLRQEIEALKEVKHGESMMFPVGRTAVLVNPTSMPKDK